MNIIVILVVSIFSLVLAVAAIVAPVLREWKRQTFSITESEDVDVAYDESLAA